MKTLGEIAEAARVEGGIDASPAQTQAWANDRYRRLVAGAKWRKLEREIGPTVADQARYTIADDVVDVLAVRVGGSAPYRLISSDELWELQSGDSRRVTTRGLFAPGFDDDTEAESVELFPTPESDGVAVTALVAVVPPVLQEGDRPKLPDDFEHVLIAGVIADGLKRIDEQHAEAQVYEQEFQDGIEALRRRRNSRVGRGPVAIRLQR